MKTSVGLMLILAAGAGFCAETYRWVDEKGVVTYGEKPPANRQAKPVNTSPGGVIETSGQITQRAEADRRRAEEDSQRPRVTAAPASPAAPVRGMEFDVYIRLQRGMTEGELLLRAGRPDYESLDGFRVDIVKTYYYFPTPSNPFTTVVTLQGGRIYELDRVRKF
jgi:hypothetical protein